MIPYRGRFAPSPTGPLHLGSLLAAAGSYLQARARSGLWLLRMEDLDTPRIVPGAADGIVRTLEEFGFEWDGPIARQSERTDLYESALQKLTASGLVFPCSCSRQELAGRQTDSPDEDEPYYPGTCRIGPKRPDLPLAMRFRTPDRAIEFVDELQGRFSQNVARTVGDFVIRRRDGLFAYQLAVVVDDGDQDISEVVRGCDLLSNTPRQMLLQAALQLPQPGYMHLPLLTEADGRKLAKSRRSIPADAGAPVATLMRILRWLGQQPPADLIAASPRELWAWAIREWDPAPLSGVRQIGLDAV